MNWVFSQCNLKIEKVYPLWQRFSIEVNYLPTIVKIHCTNEKGYLLLRYLINGLFEFWHKVNAYFRLFFDSKFATLIS